MKETSSEKSQSQLIDDTQPKEIMTNTLMKTRTTTKSDEREEIVWQGEDQNKKRQDEEKGKRRFLSSREKIGRKELIEGEGKGFGVELTLTTGRTRRTKTDEVRQSMRIALQTTTLGETMRTAIEMIIVIETFDSRVILSTDTKIEIIAETQASSISNADLMISNRR
jgi:hypothetical protein